MARRRGKGEGTVFQRKDGTWQGEVTVGYNDEGKQKRKTVYGKTQALVIAKLNDIKQQLSSDTFSSTKLTVKAYLEQWLNEKQRQVKPRTIELYTNWTNRHIAPRIGKVQLTKLTPLQVQAMMGEIADKVGVSTANKCRKMLYGALKQAVRWQVVPRNVCEAVDPIKEQPKPMKIWEAAEAVRFLDAIRAHRFYAAFYLTMAPAYGEASF